MAVFDIDFRRVPGEEVYYYRRPGVGLWEPINHAHQVGRVLLRLHQLTGEARYRRRATHIVDVFRRSLRYDRRGYPFWRYFPYFEPRQRTGRPEEILEGVMYRPVPSPGRPQKASRPDHPDAAARSFVTNLVRGGALNTNDRPGAVPALSPGHKFRRPGRMDRRLARIGPTGLRRLSSIASLNSSLPIAATICGTAGWAGRASPEATRTAWAMDPCSPRLDGGCLRSSVWRHRRRSPRSGPQWPMARRRSFGTSTRPAARARRS